MSQNRSVSPDSRAMIERLIAFDTTSRNSNLELIHYVQGYLAEHGVESHLTHDADGCKANLYATLGPDDRPGIAAGIFGPLSDANINVDMIVQNIAEDGKTTDLTFTVGEADFDRAVADYPLSQAKLARMGIAITVCRQFSYHVARLMDQGQGQMEASLVKLFACKMAEWVCREALQLHGGMGYAEETAVSQPGPFARAGRGLCDADTAGTEADRDSGTDRRPPGLIRAAHDDLLCLGSIL